MVRWPPEFLKEENPTARGQEEFMKITAINPATGEAINTYDETSSEEVASAIERAHEWRMWRTTALAGRAAIMKKTATILRERSDSLAMLMAAEMGKPLKQGIAEVEKCAWACEYYADNAELHLAPDIIKTESSNRMSHSSRSASCSRSCRGISRCGKSFGSPRPPSWPAMLALLKHSSNVPGCALAIEEIFTEAGLPKSTFRTLLIPSRQVQAVIQHRLVRAVTLTGSTPAGKAVAAQAGAALKKTVLELGGSDPYAVLEDADLNDAVQNCVNSRSINCGQSCIAAKRFIVVEPILPEFTEKFVALMKTKTVGDPFIDGTDIGPRTVCSRHTL